jgi:hypothetical protein
VLREKDGPPAAAGLAVAGGKPINPSKAATWVDVQSHVSASAPTSAGIVAKVALLGQTAPVGPIVLFKPPTAGLFRVNAYLGRINPICGDGWVPVVKFKDDRGLSFPISFSTIDHCQNTWTATTTFQQAAGAPILYGVTSNGSTEGTGYNLYITLEQLQ